ncbi:26137_t:CDS:2 [Racocetra persica]|uniref:26137_t:CDS:1 n=1 Tax=Racocetra persica TaxID=160502 RepID=A0ACA9QKE8_9GLOM|nr:26137_t:CDS:2 [Racocetra persica]
MADSPLSLELPTLQDQEFPENSLLSDNDTSWFPNSLLNDNDSSLWFTKRDSIRDSILDNSNYDNDNSLRKEYRTLLKLNEMFEKVNNNMDQANLNLQQFSNTVEQTDQLLDIWINILSQNIHTQQLLSDPSWQGSSARVLEEQAKERERQEKLTRLQQE